MYNDSAHARILLRDGRSIVSETGVIDMIFNGEDVSGVKIPRSFSTEQWDVYFSDNISNDDVSEIDVFPTEDHSHSVDDIERITDALRNSPRLRHTEKEYERIEYEMEFFTRTNNIIFLLKCLDLINKFREDNVVWGVGRGSSCSSYILYLLEINDIDPLKYNIPFTELSKEQD